MIRFGKIVSDAHALVCDGGVGAKEICGVRLRAQEGAGIYGIWLRLRA